MILHDGDVGTYMPDTSGYDWNHESTKFGNIVGNELAGLLLVFARVYAGIDSSRLIQ